MGGQDVPMVEAASPARFGVGWEQQAVPPRSETPFQGFPQNRGPPKSLPPPAWDQGMTPKRGPLADAQGRGHGKPTAAHFPSRNGYNKQKKRGNFNSLQKEN